MIKCDALIVVTHQCGYSPLPDCLVRPRSEINKISQAKYCVWVPLIEVLEHCIESGQIGVSKNVGAVRKTHQSLTAAACR